MSDYKSLTRQELNELAELLTAQRLVVSAPLGHVGLLPLRPAGRHRGAPR